MAKYVTVEVTQEDIDAGEYVHTRSCPLAKALRRAGFPCPSIVGSHWSGDADAKPALFKPLTKKASRWVYRFDHKRSVRPARLRLLLP